MGTEGTEKVLIVDDDPSALQLLETLLHASGYDVLAARDGREALDVVLEHEPHLVIADWEMPEVNGLELCRSIRNREGIGFIYFIIVSARAEQDRIIEAFDAGIDDYLTKPYSRRELLARLRVGDRIVALQQKLALTTRAVHRANAEMALTQGKLEVLNEQLARQASTDELTGLLNRREAMARLADQWDFTARHGESIACIMVDIDHFKRVNDTLGHDAGDLVLQEAARRLKASARKGEAVCRLGGEEFLVLCPGTTESAAAVAAERMRKDVSCQPIRSGRHMIDVTISLGAAQRTRETPDADAMIRQADLALYAAKKSGRNRVCAASTLSAVPVESAECSYVAPPDDGHDLLDSGNAVAPSSSSATHGVGSPGARTTDATEGRVLVVDDDESIRKLCRRLLENANYTVSEAVDGLDALTSVLQQPPDVIILDALMPNMDGLECARRLKASPQTRDIPIIMASAASTEEDILRGLQAGTEEYVVKPLRPKELLLRVRSMAQLHQSRHQLMESNELRGEQARMLSLLLEMSQELAATDDVDVILEAVVKVTSELALARRISIMLPDTEQQYLTVAHSIGIVKSLANSIRVPVGVAIAGSVFQTRRSVVINSSEELDPHPSHYDTDFFVSVPMLSTALSTADKVVGVLNVTERLECRPFKPQELECIDLIANIAATAIHDVQVRRSRDEARDSIVLAMAKLAENRDNSTGKHVDRVMQFCLVLAAELRDQGVYTDTIDDAFVDHLKRAVPLHDIGKVGVPDRILLKPGRLTDAEMAIMRTHAALGADTIQSVIDRLPGTSFLEMAEEIAHSHHEWYDGTGYPRGLVGTDIPLSARIAAVADVYDALTTERPYKEAFSHEKAHDIIVDAGDTHFDPHMVAAFVKRQDDFRRLAAELGDAPGESCGPPEHIRDFPPTPQAAYP